METATTQKERYHLLDTLRGILLIAMILYHTLYDVWSMSHQTYMVHHPASYIFQQSICWGFIFLSGICSAIGTRHFKRGMWVLAGAAAVSFVTYTFMPKEGINFGVLAFLGSAMIIMIPLKKLFQDRFAKVGFVVCLLLFLVCRNVPDGGLGFESVELCRLPRILYHNMLTAYLGFPPRGFVSGDYFPLIPWIFLYVSGFFFWNIIKDKEKIRKPLTYQIPALSFIGRHSLLIYLLHQPVCYGVVYLVIQGINYF